MNLKLLSSSQGATENEDKIYALEFQLRALPFKLRRYVLFGHPFFFSRNMCNETKINSA